MQIDCDTASGSVKREGSGFGLVDVLLFENESQLQLEFHEAIKAVDSAFDAILGPQLRKLIAWRACRGGLGLAKKAAAPVREQPFSS